MLRAAILEISYYAPKGRRFHAKSLPVLSNASKHLRNEPQRAAAQRAIVSRRRSFVAAISSSRDSTSALNNIEPTIINSTPIGPASHTLHNASHYSGNAEHRQPHRHRRASRPSLRSRSLRPFGKRNQEASTRCAPGTERWQERAGIKQFRECVYPGRQCKSERPVLTYGQFHSRRMRRTRLCGSLTTTTSRE